jgi:hypothetical protein
MNTRSEKFALNRKAPGAAAARVAARTTFKLFPKLPIELRLKIWRHSFPPSRQINICPLEMVSTLELGSPPLPTALYVNRESLHGLSISSQ